MHLIPSAQSHYCAKKRRGFANETSGGCHQKSIRAMRSRCSLLAMLNCIKTETSARDAKRLLLLVHHFRVNNRAFFLGFGIASFLLTLRFGAGAGTGAGLGGFAGGFIHVG